MVEISARRARAAIVGARTPLTLMVVLYLTLVVLPWGRNLDQAAFMGRLDTGRHLLAVSRVLLAVINVPVVAAGLLVLLWWGRRTGRIRDGMIAVAAVTGAAVSAELLKIVLPASSHPGNAVRLAGQGSFPSGHATIATALALAFLALCPVRLRGRWVGPAVVWTVGVAVATVTAGWHRPSDAVGGILLAAAWHRTLWAAARAGDAGWPADIARRDRWPNVQTTPGSASARRLSDRGVMRTLWPDGWGWRAWGWWAGMAVAELAAVMVPSPAESPWEHAAVRHYVAIAFVLVVGGVATMWASSTPAPPGGRPRSRSLLHV